MEKKTIYVVYEEDRGMGITFHGAYYDPDIAKEIVENMGHMYCEEVEILDAE